MKVKSESEVTQSCLTLKDPMDCSPLGSSIHGIFQARVLKWGAIAFSTNTTLIKPQVRPIPSLMWNPVCGVLAPGLCSICLHNERPFFFLSTWVLLLSQILSPNLTLARKASWYLYKSYYLFYSFGYSFVFHFLSVNELKKTLRAESVLFCFPT